MGLFTGYTNTKNTKNFTIDELMDRLCQVNVSFGTPIMTDIKGNRSVMYKNVTGKFDIFARVEKGKVIMGRIVTEDLDNAKKAIDKGTSIAKRAVGELLNVVKTLETAE